jgi:hypothetical protein
MNKQDTAGGIFTISLDFELHWGVSHRLSVNDYKDNLLGTRDAIKGILDLFQKYEIHATWATVGFLFCENKAEINKFSPVGKPNFENNKFNTYRLMDHIGNDESNDPYHYALNVIDEIALTPFQEIATHTFSHLFMLENGITLDDIENDINSAISVAKTKKFSMKSIVFPRNQYNEDILKLCNKFGLVFRGNPDFFYYNPMQYDENSLFIRIMRGLDSYLNFFPKICFEMPKSVKDEKGNLSLNVPGSRFLRPFSKSLVFLEGLKLHRIKSEMEFAAKNNKLYHLWWHPHNFGVNTEQNLRNLNAILIHFQKMKEKYGMVSINMGGFRDEN